MKLITLGYPRSGSTMVQFLFEHANPPAITQKLHGHDLINRQINALHDDNIYLLMVLRNYKECILSHLTRDNDQNDIEKIREAFRQYMKVIEVYEASSCHKDFIYYEDMIEFPEILLTIASRWKYNMIHVFEKIDYYLELSMHDYISKLGQPQTDGKTITFFAPQTKNYDFDWDISICALNPALYEKYLFIYGANNE